MNLWMKSLLLGVTAAFLTACGGSDDTAPPPGTVAEVATSAGFSSLIAAATKAELVPALSDESASLTVFAPTDAAFDALAQSLGFADATALVDALDGPTLAKILSYHVLPTRQGADALTAGGTTQATLYAFPGTTPATLAVDVTSGVKLTDAALNQASVTSADVPARNGVIHVVDRVLVPPGVLNIVQMAQTNPTFSVLVEAVAAAKLGGTLSGVGPFTVFAPTNDAFVAALGELGVSKDALLADSSLPGILTYHAVAARLLATDVIALAKPAVVATVQGASFSVGADLGITDGRGRVASLVATDVIGSNGVIHVIDRVLLPPR